MISLLLLLCAVHPVVGWAPANVRLLTRWASLVSPSHAHPEHPRPDKWRSGDGGASSSSWKSLNGIWEADPSPKDLSTPPFGTTLPREILVPFPFEAALSGIRELPVHDNVWYVIPQPIHFVFGQPKDTDGVHRPPIKGASEVPPSVFPLDTAASYLSYELPQLC